ncbi:MAG: hypothetical protein AAGD38_04880 [Acidobacteriota bacterium]
MKLITAEVIDGKITVPADVTEGSRVAILATDDDGPVVLSAREEEELSEAKAQIDSGQFVDGRVLLEEIKAKSRA